MHVLLFYEKAADFREREGTFRAEHRDYVLAAASRGDLVLGGSLADPEDGSALLLFNVAAKEAVEAFARADPYVREEIVCKWQVRTWHTVVGKTAAEAFPE